MASLQDVEMSQSDDPAQRGDAAAFPQSNLEIGTDSSSDGTLGTGSSSTSLQSSTQSLRSSIYHYIEENGRTYHAYNSGKYMLPNDDREQVRLDLQHQSFRIMLDGRLHLAPVEDAKHVLDLATGTGLWAIEYAQEYPDSIVLGTDLSPIQPDFIPGNCRFEVDDAEEDWTFTHAFDYVHARAIVTCFRDNRAMARKIFDSLAPGGYFELQDPCLPMRSDDNSLEGTALGEWNQLLVQGMQRIGRDLQDNVNWGQYMREAGFVDVVEHRMYVPCNPWAKGKKNKLLGAISTQNLLEGIPSMSTAVFTRVLGWDAERLETFLKKVKEDLQNRKIHSYGQVYFVYGRKPENAPYAPVA